MDITLSRDDLLAKGRRDKLPEKTPGRSQAGGGAWNWAGGLTNAQLH